jgi:hypothetical protein
VKRRAHRDYGIAFGKQFCAIKHRHWYGNRLDGPYLVDSVDRSHYYLTAEFQHHENIDFVNAGSYHQALYKYIRICRNTTQPTSKK